MNTNILPEEIILDIPGLTIAGLAWGPKQGKPIIALHGWLDNAASFIPIAGYLSDFRLIAIDLPGHGLSNHKPLGCYFHFIDYIADVLSMIDHLGWEKPCILGHSMGAGIASLLAAIFPDRVSALGLIDGIGTPTVTNANLPNMVRDSICQHTKIKYKKLNVHVSKQEAINARLSVSNMQADSVDLLVSRGLKPVEGGYVWRTDPRLLLPPLSMFTEEQNLHFLKQITADTCMLKSKFGWPCNDNTYTAKVAELANDYDIFSSRVAQLKKVQVHEIHGNHHMHMDKPEQIGPLLKEFFSRVIQ